MSRVFMLVDFWQKFNLCRGGRFTPPMGHNAPMGKMPPSLTAQFALNIYSKIRVQASLSYILKIVLSIVMYYKIITAYLKKELS